MGIASVSAFLSAGDIVVTVLVTLFLGAIYFTPSIVAEVRKVPNTGSIFILNLFLGWTLIGWVVSLAMAARTKPASTVMFVSAGTPAGPQPQVAIGANPWPTPVKAPGSGAQPAPAETMAVTGVKTCPECAEEVKAAAKVCRFCGYRFDSGSLPTQL